MRTRTQSKTKGSIWSTLVSLFAMLLLTLMITYKSERGDDIKAGTLAKSTVPIAYSSHLIQNKAEYSNGMTAAKQIEYKVPIDDDWCMLQFRCDERHLLASGESVNLLSFTDKPNIIDISTLNGSEYYKPLFAYDQYGDLYSFDYQANKLTLLVGDGNNREWCLNMEGVWDFDDCPRIFIPISENRYILTTKYCCYVLKRTSTLDIEYTYEIEPYEAWYSFTYVGNYIRSADYYANRVLLVLDTGEVIILNEYLKELNRIRIGEESKGAGYNKIALFLSKTEIVTNAGRYGPIIKWNIQSGEIIMLLGSGNYSGIGISGNKQIVVGVTNYTTEGPDGKVHFIQSYHEIQIMEAETGKMLWQTNRQSFLNGCIVCTNDGSKIIYSTSDGLYCVYKITEDESK